MSASKEIEEAISEFRVIDPDGWRIDPQPRKNIYALVRIIGWPSVVHYEFRYNRETGIYAELHAEHQQYSFLGPVFSLCAEENRTIGGYSVCFSEGSPQLGENRKRWPSLSISLGAHVAGKVSATVMNDFIKSTRPTVTKALGHWSQHRG